MRIIFAGVVATEFIQMDQLLTTDDLARLLRKSIHSIRHDLTRNPLSLPPRCALPGTNRNLFRPQDVEAWLASHVVTPDPLPCTTKQKSKRGAPTKAEGLAKKQAAQRMASGNA